MRTVEVSTFLMATRSAMPDSRVLFPCLRKLDPSTILAIGNALVMKETLENFCDA